MGNKKNICVLFSAFDFDRQFVFRGPEVPPAGQEGGKDGKKGEVKDKSDPRKALGELATSVDGRQQLARLVNDVRSHDTAQRFADQIKDYEGIDDGNPLQLEAKGNIVRRQYEEILRQLYGYDAMHGTKLVEAYAKQTKERETSGKYHGDYLGLHDVGGLVIGYRGDLGDVAVPFLGGENGFSSNLETNAHMELEHLISKLSAIVEAYRFIMDRTTGDETHRNFYGRYLRNWAVQIFHNIDKDYSELSKQERKEKIFGIIRAADARINGGNLPVPPKTWLMMKKSSLWVPVNNLFDPSWVEKNMNNLPTN